MRKYILFMSLMNSFIYSVYRVYVSRKEEGIRLANIENSVDASIKQLEEDIKRTKKGLLQRPETRQITQESIEQQ